MIGLTVIGLTVFWLMEKLSQKLTSYKVAYACTWQNDSINICINPVAICFANAISCGLQKHANQTTVLGDRTVKLKGNYTQKIEFS